VFLHADTARRQKGAFVTPSFQPRSVTAS
jgi:hypothetical protein